MGNCANCGSRLDPAWKFCIKCGLRVAHTPDDDIPGAIRHRMEPKEKRDRVDPMLAFGAIMAVVGVAIIIWVAIIVFSPRG
jgi:predicted amidophosphoribosyltransferase